MSLLDSISVVPTSGLEDATGWDLSPWEGAADNFGKYTGATRYGQMLEPFANFYADRFFPHSAEDSSEISDMLGFLKDYMGELFETSETAAKNQAERNEIAAYNAWQRSEQAADAALQRARALRKTSYQDAVSSLKAAGLNPVLAAGGGISGSAVTAPQANAPASQSGMADGLNGADLLMAIAALLSGAGSLIGAISPRRIISNTTSDVTSNITSTSENTNWSHIYSHNSRK